jgi:hypothetical protein
MSTKAEAGKPAVADEFAMYPLYKVVSIFDDPAIVDAAVAELKDHGFKEDDIEAYCGLEGKKDLHFHGTRKGKLAGLIRAIQHVGPERTYLERYEKGLDEGRCLIAVAVRNKERKDTAGRILNHHTNERVTYFGLLAADEIKPT